MLDCMYHLYVIITVDWFISLCNFVTRLKVAIIERIYIYFCYWHSIWNRYLKHFVWYLNTSTLLLLSPSVALLSPLVSKLQTYLSIIHSAHVMWNSLLSDVRHVAHPVIHSPKLNSPVSDVSTSIFLKKLKTHLCRCSYPIISIHLGYLRTDISGIDQASLFHLILTSLSFIHSFMPFFILFYNSNCLWKSNH